MQNTKNSKEFWKPFQFFDSDISQEFVSLNFQVQKKLYDSNMNLPKLIAIVKML